MVKYKNIISLLDKRQKKLALILVNMMVLGMLLEILGIGAIIPILSSVVDPNYFKSSLFTRIGLDINLGQHYFLLIIILMLLYLFKFLFLSYLAWKQSDFVWNLNADLSSKIYSTYLYQDYSFYFKRNSAELLRNVFGETAQFSAAVMALGNLIAELLVVIGISILVIIYKPDVASIVILFFLLTSATFYYLIKSRLNYWGKRRQLHEGLRLKSFNEGIKNIKEIKLMDRTESFIDNYSTHTSISSNMSKFNRLLQSFPRLLLEFLGVLSLCLFLIFVLNVEGNIINAVPVLGVFAAAAFRIMPSINRILYSLQTLRFTNAVVQNLKNEISLKKNILPKEDVPILKFNDNIKFNNISYVYPGTKKAIFQNVNLSFKKGEFIGIQGPNGSGKSTILDLLLGLIKPTAGSLTIDDKPIKSIKSWQKNIGYVSQNINLIDSSIRKNIALGILDIEINENRIQDLVRKLDMVEMLNNLPDGLDTIVGEDGVKLSGGQKQKIVIARSLYHNPQVLILDEASSALDTKSENQIIEIISKIDNITIFLVTHREASLKKCTYTIKLPI